MSSYAFVSSKQGGLQDIDCQQTYQFSVGIETTLGKITIKVFYIICSSSKKGAIEVRLLPAVSREN